MRNLQCTANLSERVQALLASVTVKRKLKAGDTVWKMGDPGEFLVVIQSGLVEITRYASRDEEISMGVFGPSDAIGISAVMTKTPYPGTAKVLPPGTELLQIYLRPLFQQIGQRETDSVVAEIYAWVREMMIAHEQILRDKIEILNAGNVEHRFFELLSHLTRRFGRQESQQRRFIPLQLTRAQVGKLIDVRVETIIRLASRWKKLNLLHWTKEGMLIENLQTLEASLTPNCRHT